MKLALIRLFGLALEGYDRRQHHLSLFSRINRAYSDEPNGIEYTLGQNARRTHRRIVDGEWTIEHD